MTTSLYKGREMPPHHTSSYRRKPGPVSRLNERQRVHDCIHIGPYGPLAGFRLLPE